MIKVLSLTLIRNKSQIDLFDENKVESTLRVNFHIDSRFKKYLLPMVENRDYLVPEGVWEIRYEKSAKFKKYCWEFKGLPYQQEIKFHSGTKAKHSKGCIVSTPKVLALMNSILKTDETHYITIKNE